MMKAAIAVLLAIAAGLAALALHYRGKAVAEAAAHETTKRDYRAAQAKAEQAHTAARTAAEARYRALAQRIDQDAKQTLVRAQGATDRFVAANRCVRAEAPSSPAGRTAPAAESGSAGVPAPVPADSFVAVSDVDVRACAGAVSYALEAHHWALGL